MIDKYLRFDYLNTNNILSTLLCLILYLKQKNKETRYSDGRSRLLSKFMTQN